MVYFCWTKPIPYIRSALYMYVSFLPFSLLPWPLHPKVAKDCIAHKTDMVTASYCTDAMRELHKEAMEAGVTVVNEVGADPGIDHLLAMECFDEVGI